MRASAESCPQRSNRAKSFPGYGRRTMNVRLIERWLREHPNADEEPSGVIKEDRTHGTRSRPMTDQTARVDPSSIETALRSAPSRTFLDAAQNQVCSNLKPKDPSAIEPVW